MKRRKGEESEVFVEWCITNGVNFIIQNHIFNNTILIPFAITTYNAHSVDIIIIIFIIIIIIIIIAIIFYTHLPIKNQH